MLMPFTPAGHAIAHFFPLRDLEEAEDGSSPNISKGPGTKPSLTHLASLPTIPASTSSSHRSKSKSTASSPPALTPGSNYPLYSSEDPTGAFPHTYELVLKIGARWVGATVEELAESVAKFERKMIWNVKRARYRSRAEKKGKGGKGMQSVRSSARSSPSRGGTEVEGENDQGAETQSDGGEGMEVN